MVKWFQPDALSIWPADVNGYKAAVRKYSWKELYAWMWLDLSSWQNCYQKTVSCHRRIITLVRSELWLSEECFTVLVFQVLILHCGQRDTCSVCVCAWLHRLAYPMGRVTHTVLVVLQVWCAECSGSTTIIILLPTAAANPDADRLLLHAAACLHTAGVWVPTGLLC